MTWNKAYKIARVVEKQRAQVEAKASRVRNVSWQQFFDPLAVVTLAEWIKEEKR